MAADIKSHVHAAGVLQQGTVLSGTINGKPVLLVLNADAPVLVGVDQIRQALQEVRSRMVDTDTTATTAAAGVASNDTELATLAAAGLVVVPSGDVTAGSGSGVGRTLAGDRSSGGLITVADGGSGNNITVGADIDGLASATPVSTDTIVFHDADAGSAPEERKATIAAIVSAATPGSHTHVAADVTDFSTEVVAILTDANIPNDLTLTNITQITNRSHTDLSDIGTTSHADIDTHIGAANPHSGSQPLDATLTALAAYSTNGLLTQTAADTFAGRSIAVGGGGSLAVSNGDGVSGNPTVSRAALTGDVTASADSNATTLATKFKTVSRAIYIEDPTASDEFPLGYVPDAATMVAVRAITDTGTVDFNIEKRGKLTPDVAGTDVWSADKQATAAGLEQTSFDSGAISADQWLHYSASAVASSPTKLWISIEYTVD